MLSFTSEESSKCYCGLSKFCDLRPTEVKLNGQVPQNECLSLYHENIRLLLLALYATEKKNITNRFLYLYIQNSLWPRKR